MILIATSSTIVLIFGTVGMFTMAGTVAFFLYLNHRNTINHQATVQSIERQQQKLLLSASLEMQEEERQRIAADLHDDVGPLLATIRLYLNENMVNLDKNSQLQAIANSKQIVDDTISLIRNISHSLMPPTLKNFGLESAVADYFQKINKSNIIQTSCRFHEYQDNKLTPAKELLLYRIINELTNNIIKHSQATKIHLTQNTKNGIFYLRLHHDGVGLTQEKFDKLSLTGKGLGLKNIRSRLTLLNGNINFEFDNVNKYYKAIIDLPY